MSRQRIYVRATYREDVNCFYSNVVVSFQYP
jgi:hypothetical protein